MAKTSEMIESKYLKKDDVGEGVLATVDSLERKNVAQEGKPAENKWLMHFRELEKPLILNSTNIQLCEHIFESDDTDDWIGHKIVLYDDPSISFAGKLTGGIRVRKPRTKPAPERMQEVAERETKKAGGNFSDLSDDIPF